LLEHGLTVMLVPGRPPSITAQGVMARGAFILPSTGQTPMNAMSDATRMRESIRSREVGWTTLILFLITSTGVSVLLLAVRRVGPLGRLLAGPAWRENLLFFALLLLVVVGGVIFGIGQLRPSDVGAERSKLREGAITLATVWVIMQFVTALGAVVGGEPIVVARTWSNPGVSGTLIWAAVMFLGTAAYEEIAFRGFLYPQLYLKVPGSPRTRFWVALLSSQLVFALGHAPAHLVIRHLSGALLMRMLVLQWFAGIMLLLLYLRTRNLWIVMGIHGLADAPAPLFQGAMGWEYSLVVLLIGWPWLTRRPAQRGFAGVEVLPWESRVKGSVAWINSSATEQ
jgi:hypothetical protein